MRTHEQVVADAEKRFNELKEEATKPKNMKPCRTCLHCRVNCIDTEYCTNPLVIPMHVRPREVRCDNRLWHDDLRLCKDRSFDDPEQALWEPRLTLFQKFINIFKGE